MPAYVTIRGVALAAALFAFASEAASQNQVPERVQFQSADGKTMLVGYLYRPAHAEGRVPAVVMMHGRAGPYSSRAHGVYDASTLSMRHRAWGLLWAEQGYVALLVDSARPCGGL
jgi:carboxymethylenebutenolidase